MEVSPEVVLGGAIALTGCVVWIEKRFRDAKKDASDGDDKVIRALDLATAEHRNAAARLERRNAELTAKITEIQLGVARDFRDYPTKADLQTMSDNFGDRVDRLEARIEGHFQKRNRNGP